MGLGQIGLILINHGLWWSLPVGLVLSRLNMFGYTIWCIAITRWGCGRDGELCDLNVHIIWLRSTAAFTDSIDRVESVDCMCVCLQNRIQVKMHLWMLQGWNNSCYWVWILLRLYM